jgi:hypothetical protein
MAKVRTAAEVKKFTDIPNVAKAVAAKYVLLGITKPVQLVGQDGFSLYQKLCRKTGVRHDPCLLDTFLAVADFMNGAPAKHWFKYTKDRKRKYPSV